jgi:hypothetical protein
VRGDDAADVRAPAYWQLEELAVDVAFDESSVPRRCTISLRLPERLTEEQRERLLRVAGKCPVHKSLQLGVSFEEAGAGGPGGRLMASTAWAFAQ